MMKTTPLRAFLYPLLFNFFRLGKVCSDGIIKVKVNETAEILEADYTMFGRTAAISSDGNYAAVGGTGTLQLYQKGRVWLPGQDLSTHISHHIRSISISLSANGHAIVVGVPSPILSRAHVFKYEETLWVKIGDAIESYFRGFVPTFGVSVAISDDANTVAVADRGLDYVKVYNYLSTWKAKMTFRNGNVYFGLPLFDDLLDYSWFGSSIAMTGNAGILLVGAPRDRGGSGPNMGSVSIFNVVTATRIQKIEGEHENEYLGNAVTMSEDGMHLGVSACGSGDSGGFVDVYEFKISAALQYIKVGSRIYVNDAQISMSSDGNRILIGSQTNTDDGVDAGKAYIYDINSEGLTLVGVIKREKESQSKFGKFVGLSRDGSMAAVGSLHHGQGFVGIYDLGSL